LTYANNIVSVIIHNGFFAAICGWHFELGKSWIGLLISHVLDTFRQVAEFIGGILIWSHL